MECRDGSRWAHVISLLINPNFFTLNQSNLSGNKPVNEANASAASTIYLYVMMVCIADLSMKKMSIKCDSCGFLVVSFTRAKLEFALISLSLVDCIPITVNLKLVKSLYKKSPLKQARS